MMTMNAGGSFPDETIGMKHIMHAILHLLDKSKGFACPSRIAADLAGQGMAVSEHTVRLYLKKLDSEGLTTGGTDKNKTLTDKGRRELTQSFASSRATSILNTISSFSERMDFDPETGEGSVILNVSLVPEEKADKALQLMALTLCSPYILSERIVTAGGGEAIGDVSVPHGSVGIGTVCSLSFNGIFMHAGIPVFPRMGGVVKIEGNRAVGFHDFISYECSSVAPLEIIIKSGLTEVRKAIFMGSGNILGSFREIPAGRFQEAKDLLKKLSAHGIKDTILFGEPGKALLDIPVPDGRIGIIVPGGTNAHAALHEAGLSTSLQAIATLYPYQELRAAAICAEQGAVLPLQDPSDLK